LRLVGAISSSGVKGSVVGLSHFISSQILGVIRTSAITQLTFTTFLTYHSHTFYQSKLLNLRS